jgi:predicted outer membrane repeat protein
VISCVGSAQPNITLTSRVLYDFGAVVTGAVTTPIWSERLGALGFEPSPTHTLLIVDSSFQAVPGIGHFPTLRCTRCAQRLLLVGVRLSPSALTESRFAAAPTVLQVSGVAEVGMEGVECRGMLFQGYGTPQAAPTCAHIQFDAASATNSLSIRRSAFTDNRGFNMGWGALAVTTAILTNASAPVPGNTSISLDGVQCSGNLAAAGACLYVRDATAQQAVHVRLANTSITSNSAMQGGGALYADAAASLTLVSEASNITGNAAGSGGALYIDMDAPIDIQLTSGSALDRNTADTGPGGGAYIKGWQSAVAVSSSASSISRNTAHTAGGGLFFYARCAAGGMSRNATGCGSVACDSAGVSVTLTSGSSMADNTALRLVGAQPATCRPSVHSVRSRGGRKARHTAASTIPPAWEAQVVPACLSPCLMQLTV